MTRTDKITRVLIDLAEDPAPAFWEDRGEFLAGLSAKIIALCTPTAYASIKDVSVLTGRNRNTIGTWIQRGQHDCPQALGDTGAGQIWDRDEWVAWVQEHPGLVGRVRKAPRSE